MKLDLVNGWVRVVVEIDGLAHVLGQALWMNDRGDDPETYADVLLKAWDEAREAAERTLRLYGAEGVARALTTPVTSDGIPVDPDEPGDGRDLRGGLLP